MPKSAKPRDPALGRYMMEFAWVYLFHEMVAPMIWALLQGSFGAGCTF